MFNISFTFLSITSNFSGLNITKFIPFIINELLYSIPSYPKDLINSERYWSANNQFPVYHLASKV